MNEVALGIFTLLGGIGLFLFGINFMSAGLKNAAGDNLRVVLEKATKNGVVAVIIGAVATALIQSSGATSVMVLGFVNAGLMNLAQSLFVMLGANIGTTVTAMIISFSIDSVAPLILFIGIIMYLFIKKSFWKKIGEIVLGFGTLFVGISMIKESADALQLGRVMEIFLDSVKNPLVSILFGALITFIMQSSSASIGILQVVVASAAGSALGLSSVVYIILGMNIGACSPVVIASIGGDRKGKKVAMANVVAKVIGVLVFAILMLIFPKMVAWIESIAPGNISRQMAYFHLLFNIVATLCICPLVKVICKAIEKIWPNDPDMEITLPKLIFLNPQCLLDPAIGITQAKREIQRMAQITSNNIHLAENCFFNEDLSSVDRVFEVEKTINYLNHEITAYLVKLNAGTLNGKTRERLGMMFNVVTDIERIGDHAENVAEYTQTYYSHHSRMNPEAFNQLKEMFDKSLEVVDMSFDVYFNEKQELLSTVSDLEEEVDGYQDKLIEDHIARLKRGECNPRGGVIFTDMVTDIERCSDHAINVAFAINGEPAKNSIKKQYIVTRGQ